MSLIVLLTPTVVIASPRTYTYADFVRQLTDLSLLAQRPAAGETEALASSYDRRSRYDAATDTYVEWDADADGTGVARMEGNEAVLADIQGPGCIFRMWAATAAEGHVKIFLDGSDTPAVDLPFSGYFDGKNEPFTQPTLVYTIFESRIGFNNYTPIPFQKSCKIVADPGWGRYFQFNYWKFAAGTVVPTFTRTLSPADTAALVHANALLSNLGQAPSPAPPGQGTTTKTITVPAGKSVVIYDRKGPGAITEMRAKFALPDGADVQSTFLRQIALRITWDNQAHPAVWSPWGDFFGDSRGATPFQSLPVGLDQDGTWQSRWYMPYASRALICVDNDSAAPLSMSWQITQAPLSSARAASLLRFHAKWHRDAFLPVRKDRRIDWTLLMIKGMGRYVGTQLDISNPRGGWWGEGDEKFFVDGEKFPSDFGTGSEDYFGDSWGLYPLFAKAFHGATKMADFDRGFLSVHRWHIPDNVPFQTSFEGDIEKYYSNESPEFTRYAAVSYWYLDPAGTDPYPVIPVQDRIGYWVTPPIMHEPGVIEGEDLPILQQQPADSASHADAVTLSLPPLAISNDRALFWKAQQTGQRLNLGLNSVKAGKYRVIARFLHKDNGGIYQIAINGQDLGAPVDLYEPAQGDQVEATRNSGGSLFYATVTDPVDLGICDLSAGQNTLSVTLVGENKDRSKDGSDRAFFLDYLKLIPANQ